MSLAQSITLVIAVLGLLISVISLTWQFAAWRLTGSVVKVELLAGAAGNGGVVSGAIESFKPDAVISQGFGELLFVVRARILGEWQLKEVSSPSSYRQP